MAQVGHPLRAARRGAQEGRRNRSRRKSRAGLRSYHDRTRPTARPHEPSRTSHPCGVAAAPPPIAARTSHAPGPARPFAHGAHAHALRSRCPACTMAPRAHLRFRDSLPGRFLAIVLVGPPAASQGEAGGGEGPGRLPRVEVRAEHAQPMHA
eukprot:2448235-Prymnesium_polylepis.1